MSESQRNFLILGIIAVLGVMFSGAFGTTTGIASTIVSILFVVVTIAFLVMLYQRNSGTIGLMKARYRLQLQGSAVLLLVVIITGLGVPPFLQGWSSAGGLAPVVFFAALGASIYGIYDAWRNRYA